MGEAWNKRKGRTSSWIRIKRRQQIYARDDETCVYCTTKRPWRGLCLDHVKPRIKGGSNDSTNLVSACSTCNNRRQHRSLRGWCIEIAGETNQDWREVIARVNRQRKRKLPEWKERSECNTTMDPLDNATAATGNDQNMVRITRSA